MNKLFNNIIVSVFAPKKILKVSIFDDFDFI